MLSEKGGARKSTGSAGHAGGSFVDDKTTGGGISPRIRTDVVLPQTKIKVIMKSSPEIDNLSSDSVFIIAKATELFIEHLSNTAYTSSKGTKNVSYKNLSDVVHKNQNMEFLRDIIPIKIPARVALQEMARQSALENKEILE